MSSDRAVRRPARSQGRREGEEGSGRVATGRGEPFDWMPIWSGCERRVRSWPVPPRWSAREWREEIRAEGAMAMLLAVQDYQPEHQVPLGVYVRMRIMARILTRYRQEWTYALRHAPVEQLDDPAEDADSDRSVSQADELKWALEQLDATDRDLIERLYWRQETEAEVARGMGLSQQAISKRKRSIIKVISYKMERYKLLSGASRTRPC